MSYASLRHHSTFHGDNGPSGDIRQQWHAQSVWPRSEPPQQTVRCPWRGLGGVARGPHPWTADGMPILIDCLRLVLFLSHNGLSKKKNNVKV